MRTHIDHLFDHPEHIRLVAGWIYDEFWKGKPGYSVATFESLLRQARDPDRVPLSLLALADGHPAGTVNLVHTDSETRPDLHPWLAALVVVPEHRRRGVGTALVRELTQHAARLGFHEMFLGTDIPGFYSRLGAEHFQPIRGDLCIMRFSLANDERGSRIGWRGEQISTVDDRTCESGGTMSDSPPDELKVFEDEHFTVEQCGSCLIPGYLILRLKGPAVTMGQLAHQASGRLGEMLSRTARAIGEVVTPERLYVLSFCEIDQRLHFHLFPRTRPLLQAYRRAAGSLVEPVSGPKLFEWARTAIVPGSPVPPGLEGVEQACAALRATMKG
ncbi:MAG: GNAT family N-acetyltransferase [Thermoanaerobaculaceae bacterium]|jgi:predicted N-acetyltransferase YhbS/diadenosine tetraphosphate (Ap4A) HIT family hydrolase